jgi:NAD(P)-dependent dehydrogenase (short-subunit alcohol dehydrogenase family)
MGAAIAERFAEHGAAVCVNDADADLARSKAAALRARGARAIHHAGSVTDLL